jgi:glycosyltransferase involved in cell wall biosynthesis
MTARVSVCIPVWNDSQWLPGAIESVLAQDHHDWELIIGDNASDEDVGAVVARYQDPRIRFHRFDSHTDLYESFNRVCQLSRFEWVQLLSADDRLLPHCLSRIASRIDAHPASAGPVAMVLSDCYRVDPDGEPADEQYFGHQRVMPIPDGTYDAAGWFDVMAYPGQSPWNNGSIAFSRAILERTGWYHPEVGWSADTELVLRVAAYGAVIYIDEKLLRYTVRGSSDASSRNRRLLASGAPETPMQTAWRFALRTHERFREIAPAQRARIENLIARSHIQRALQHRTVPGRGRRGAASDVWTAFASSPGLVRSPWHVGTSLLAVIAPASTVRWTVERLAAHRRGR